MKGSSPQGGPTPLVFATTTLAGGTGSHLVQVLSHLDRSVWNPELVNFGPGGPRVPEGVSVVDASARGPLHRFPIAQMRQLRVLHDEVRRTGADLVHAYFFWPIMYGRILKRLGVIDHLVENREDMGFNWSANDYRMLRLTSGLPDRVICVSDAVREVVLEREGLPRDRTAVIRNGINLPDRISRDEEAEQLRRSLGVPPDAPLVGMVTTLDRPIKGVDRFIEAIPLILEAQGSAHFIVVGEGPLRGPLERRAAELGVDGKVHFVGFQQDVDPYYRAMDISVLTSLSEGLSITILESMSHGLPVVATRVGGNPELVQHGETGLLTEPKDLAEFSGSVSRLIGAPEARQAMGTAGRRFVEKHFTLDQVTDQYQRIYEELHGAPG